MTKAPFWSQESATRQTELAIFNKAPVTAHSSHTLRTACSIRQPTISPRYTEPTRSIAQLQPTVHPSTTLSARSPRELCYDNHSTGDTLQGIATHIPRDRRQRSVKLSTDTPEIAFCASFQLPRSLFGLSITTRLTIRADRPRLAYQHRRPLSTNDPQKGRFEYRLNITEISYRSSPHEQSTVWPEQRWPRWL